MPPLRFDHPPPEPLASAPGFLLSWHGQRTAATFVQALAPLGLHPRHFGVMNLIESHPGTTQRDLVHRSLIDPSSMVAVIDELEAMGLAERRPHPDDRRKHAVHLTAKGKRTLGRARKVAVEVADELLAPLSEDEVKALRGLLRKLAGLDAESERRPAARP
jgi:DNA-binding MarR family transcriptional regulator